MSPIIGILLVGWIIRALIGKSDANISSNGTEVSPALVAAFLKIVLVLVALSMSHGLGSFVVALIVLPLCFPSLFIHLLLRPLGWFRMTYYLVRITWPFGFRKENKAGAVLYAALVLSDKSAKTEKIDWLRRRLPNHTSPSLVAELAMGMLAALNGEKDTARLIFQAADSHAAFQTPRKLRRIARDWLVMDALDHEEWQEAIWRGCRGKHSYRWSYFVAQSVKRIDQRPKAFRHWKLCVLWLVAPRRISSLPLLRRALSTEKNSKKQKTSRPGPKDFPSALSDLATMLSQVERLQRAPAREEFLSCVSWMDIRLQSEQLGEIVQVRLHSVDALYRGSPERVVEQFREQFIKILVPVIEQWPGLVKDEYDRPIIKEAIEMMKHQLFQDIEVRCEDFAKRTENETTLSLELEWAAWSKLCSSANSLLKISPVSEDALFNEMYVSICNFAVFQHNSLSRHSLAHNIFWWLNQHANSNLDARQLLNKNLKARI